MKQTPEPADSDHCSVNRAGGTKGRQTLVLAAANSLEKQSAHLPVRKQAWGEPVGSRAGHGSQVSRVGVWMLARHSGTARMVDGFFIRPLVASSKS